MTFIIKKLTRFKLKYKPFRRKDMTIARHNCVTPRPNSRITVERQASLVCPEFHNIMYQMYKD